MTTLEERKHRIRSTRTQRERSQLAGKVQGGITLKKIIQVIVGLAALALAFGTIIAVVLLMSVLP